MKSVIGKISKKWNKLKEKLEQKYSELTGECVLVPVSKEDNWLDRLQQQRGKN